MAGMRKFSRPNTIRLKAVLSTPVIAGMWSLLVIHCSVKEATKSAVL